MINLPEKTISIKDIYTGKIISVKVATVEIKDQRYSQREIVIHTGGACIVALNEDNKIILVKQFRKAIENFTIELPAGKLESNEDPKECVKRELLEETGYIAQDVQFINSFFSSPGFSTEVIYMYYSKVNLKESAQNEDDEVIELIEMSLDEALTLLNENKICDAKTIIGLNWLKSNRDLLKI